MLLLYMMAEGGRWAVTYEDLNSIALPIRTDKEFPVVSFCLCTFWVVVTCHLPIYLTQRLQYNHLT